MSDDKPRFNDRIITEGFPDAWHIQDRICQDQALLLRKSDFSIFGSVCICTRPRAMSTDDWVLTAQIIAHGFEAENNKRATPSPVEASLLGPMISRTQELINEAENQSAPSTRVTALREAIDAVQELAFSADNDLECAKLDGLTEATEAIEALIEGDG